jgi:hypothetical protein
MAKPQKPKLQATKTRKTLKVFSIQAQLTDNLSNLPLKKIIKNMKLSYEYHAWCKPLNFVAHPGIQKIFQIEQP